MAHSVSGYVRYVSMWFNTKFVSVPYFLYLCGMKILHTADWHLGKYLNNFSLLEDQRHILAQFTNMVKEHKPDIILLAGDIYDRSVPPAEAIKLFDDVMSEIILTLKIPVIAIAGNHDNAERVGYCNGILEKQGLHMFGKLGEASPLHRLPQITLQDAFGDVHFFPIPFTEPETLRFLTRKDGQESSIRTHQDVMDWVTTQINAQCPTGRRILIGHAFVAGGEASDSERDLMVVGGVSYVKASTFDAFTYTALGHLHAPQSFKEKVRYSGSPLKYSFSEAHHSKSITLLTLDANGIKDEAVLPFLPLHDMHRVKGVIEDFTFKITSKGNESVGANDFLEVTLENEVGFLNPMSIIQKTYPNAMHLRRSESVGKRKNQALDASSLKDMSEADLFVAFFKKCYVDKELTEKQIGFLGESIRSLRDKD